MDIAIIVFDGFDEIDAIAPFEILTSAGFAVALVTIREPAEVVSQHGLRLAITRTLDHPDAVIVHTVVPERVVDDGDRITAGGLTAGIDLALHITQREKGTAARDRVAAAIEYNPQGRAWHAPPNRAAI